MPFCLLNLSLGNKNEFAIKQFTLRELDDMEYCQVCNILRMKRTKHCKFCNSCISGFDHHCPWIGTCIGTRNYNFFFISIASILVSALYIDFCAVRFIFLWAGQFYAYPFFLVILSPLLAFWTSIVVLFVGALFLLHVILVYTGKTTQEFLKGSKQDRLEHESAPTKLTIQHPATKYQLCGLIPVYFYHSLLEPMWEEIHLDEDVKDNFDDGVPDVVLPTQSPTTLGEPSPLEAKSLDYNFQTMSLIDLGLSGAGHNKVFMKIECKENLAVV